MLGCAMPFAGASRAARPPAGSPTPAPGAGAGTAPGRRASWACPFPFSAAASRRSCPALSAKSICCGRVDPYNSCVCLSTSSCEKLVFSNMRKR